jgi:hypothetical protein
VSARLRKILASGGGAGIDSGKGSQFWHSSTIEAARKFQNKSPNATVIKEPAPEKNEYYNQAVAQIRASLDGTQDEGS